MKAASRRWRSVRYWQIWGEPGRAEVFQPLPNNKPKGPRIYARMLDAAYQTLKERSRRNIVIGGNTFTVGEVLPAEFIHWMRLPNGKPPRLDYWGHNPFSTRMPNLRDANYLIKGRDFGDLDLLIRDVRRVYRRINRRPRLWISEYTIQSDHGSHDFNFFVSRREQADWLRAAMRIARRNSWIAALTWYQLLDEPESIANNAHWGLLTYTLGRKPAFNVFRKESVRYGQR